MRFRLLLPVQEYRRVARLARLVLARRGRLWFVVVASRFLQQLVHARPLTQAAGVRDRTSPALAPHPRGARSIAVGAFPSSAHGRHLHGRRVLRALRGLHRAPSRANQDRARRTRFRLRRPHISHGLLLPSDRRRVLRFATASFARTKSPSCAMAMPRSASAGASSRKPTRFSAPSGSPVASARAAAVIIESIGIPSHLSLPPLAHPVLILRIIC